MHPVRDASQFRPIVEVGQVGATQSLETFGIEHHLAVFATRDRSVQVGVFGEGEFIDSVGTIGDIDTW